MTHQIVPPTASMQARASVLLSHAATWARGTRTEDGQPFVLFAGSKGATYMITERGCTCPSFLHRGECSHHVAVCRFEAEHEYAIEQAFADVAARGRQPIRSYADLFPPSDFD
jgi:hypothetical protein